MTKRLDIDRGPEGEYRGYAVGKAAALREWAWRREARQSKRQLRNLASRRSRLRKPEHYKAKKRHYYETHKAEILAKSRAWKRQNRKKVNAYARAWRARNPEKVKLREKKRRRNTPARKARLKAWKAANKAWVREHNRRWRNSPKGREAERRKKARQLRAKQEASRGVTRSCSVCGCVWCPIPGAKGRPQGKYCGPGRCTMIVKTRWRGPSTRA